MPDYSVLSWLNSLVGGFRVIKFKLRPLKETDVAKAQLRSLEEKSAGSFGRLSLTERTAHLPQTSVCLGDASRWRQRSRVYQPASGSEEQPPVLGGTTSPALCTGSSRPRQRTRGKRQGYCLTASLVYTQHRFLLHGPGPARLQGLRLRVWPVAAQPSHCSQKFTAPSAYFNPKP